MRFAIKSQNQDISLKLPMFTIYILPIILNYFLNINIDMRDLYKVLKDNYHDLEDFEFIHIYSANGDEVIVTL